MTEIRWRPYVHGVAKPTPAVVDDLERTLGVALPPDYKAALVAHAGEIPHPNAIKVGEKLVTVLGPLLFPAAMGPPGHEYGIERVIEDLEDAGWQRSSRRFFPFATNTANGVFCLEYSGSRPPVVYLNLDYQPEHPKGVTRVAISFSEALEQVFEPVD